MRVLTAVAVRQFPQVGQGMLAWFATPPVDVVAPPQPFHSVAYLAYKQRQRSLKKRSGTTSRTHRIGKQSRTAAKPGGGGGASSILDRDKAQAIVHALQGCGLMDELLATTNNTYTSIYRSFIWREKDQGNSDTAIAIATADVSAAAIAAAACLTHERRQHHLIILTVIVIMTDAVSSNQTEIRNFPINPDEVVANATANSLKQHRDSAVSVNESHAAAAKAAATAASDNEPAGKPRGNGKSTGALKPPTMEHLPEAVEEQTSSPVPSREAAPFSRDALPTKVPIRERTVDNASTMTIASQGTDTSPAAPVQQAQATTQQQPQPQQTQQQQQQRSTMASVESSDEGKAARLQTVFMEPNVHSVHKVFGERFALIARVIKSLSSQYEAVAAVDQHAVSQSRKLLKKSVTFSSDFAQHGGLEELYSKAREPILCHEDYHAARAAYLNDQIQPALRQLLSEIEIKRDELKRSHGANVAKSVNRQRRETRRQVGRLSSIMSRTLSRSSAHSSSKDDPYIVNQNVLSQLDRQLNTESLFQQVACEREQALFQFEAELVERLKQVVIGLLQWDGGHCAETSARLTDARQPLNDIRDEDDQTAFIRNRRGSLFDPTTSPLATDQVYYRNRDSIHVQPIREGPLMYRLDNDFWKTGHFVITAIGYLHGFPRTSAPSARASSGPLFSLRLEHCTIGQYGMMEDDPFTWTVTEHEKSGGFLHRHSLGGGGGGSTSTRVVSLRANNEPSMLDWWNTMVRISQGESPLTITPPEQAAGAQPSDTGGGEAATAAAAIVPATAAGQTPQDTATGRHVAHPYEESPTLPEDSPFVGATKEGAPAAQEADERGDRAPLVSPTKFMEGPVVRYPHRVAQPIAAPNIGVPLSTVGDRSSSPSLFGLAADDDEEEARAARVAAGGNEQPPPIPVRRRRPLSQLAAIDPGFPEYTRGLTRSQKQHVGEVLVAQGKDAAANAAHSLGIGVFAACAGERRLVNHEHTRDAAKHVDQQQMEQAHGWRALPFFDERTSWR
ncbi:hypothetical protein SYNPS1DRAFT_28130 [Syncephalis pseudoplumigaleata]|uniref:PH domain-containing protein n=1 Tax=Syncephalis pseudoplumigaleata TaxID=1712513 RepID=A0A4P9Z161_9FUNG|nr:hypothetical protein SYNPS1DRAFT_28130 [Syncephalis pseudoplumigaleata]|eukprot:RKP26164.1 hypothetical protein SYNPS1DRAFT_28130 [Syncephalis pseudoplumigaleata]